MQQRYLLKLQLLKSPPYRSKTLSQAMNWMKLIAKELIKTSGRLRYLVINGESTHRRTEAIKLLYVPEMQVMVDYKLVRNGNELL